MPAKILSVTTSGTKNGNFKTISINNKVSNRCGEQIIRKVTNADK